MTLKICTIWSFFTHSTFQFSCSSIQCYSTSLTSSIKKISQLIVLLTSSLRHSAIFFLSSCHLWTFTLVSVIFIFLIISQWWLIDRYVNSFIKSRMFDVECFGLTKIFSSTLDWGFWFCWVFLWSFLLSADLTPASLWAWLHDEGVHGCCCWIQ